MTESLATITRTIEDYFHGTHNADSARIQRAFHPDAKITGMFDGHYTEMTLEQFIARVIDAKANRPESAAQYDKSITAIDYHHDIAMVKARVLVDDTYFTDYITLLKINEQWVIGHKSFSNHV